MMVYLASGIALLFLLGIIGMCLDWRERRDRKNIERDWPEDD